MKTIYKIVIAACMLTLCTSASIARTKTGVQPTIYVFGVAQSFADSVCYMSSIQKLDGATFDKNGLLNDRALYSDTFSQYISEKYGQPASFSSLLFGTSRKKAERQYLRIRSHYMKREHTLVKELPAADFQFKARKFDYVN